MAKDIYCAVCGVRVEVQQKALPKLGRVIGIVVPHICPEGIQADWNEFITRERPSTAPPKGGNFPFVEKLNREMGKLEQPSFSDQREDRPVSSTAPGGISNLLMSKGKLQTDPREVGASGSEEPDDGGFEMGD